MEKCFRDLIFIEDIMNNLNTVDHAKICTTDEDNCKKTSINIDTSTKVNTDADADTRLILISTGVGLGVVFLLIGGLATFFLAKKIKCCHREKTPKNELAMAPLRTAGRPLPLAQFRQRNDPCRPTQDEFEKMENDARARNISKSQNTGMKFVRSKPPINRYFTHCTTGWGGHLF